VTSAGSLIAAASTLDNTLAPAHRAGHLLDKPLLSLKRQDVPLKTILANMEEWRWMPQDLGETYVWVNVPEFKLRVVRNGQVVYTDRVVTGQEDKQTPVFSEDLKTIFFNPRWYIPESIKMKEIKPNISGGYFARHGYRVVRDGHAVDPATVYSMPRSVRSATAACGSSIPFSSPNCSCPSTRAGARRR
jgi:hypothetical protein